jgi:XapX domain-containing protein
LSLEKTVAPATGRNLIQAAVESLWNVAGVNAYVVSLFAGVLAGILYGFLGVKSPAPPLVALLGLLGLLVGEQLVVIGKRVVHGEPVTKAWVARECAPQVTGIPPAASSAAATANPEKP